MLFRSRDHSLLALLLIAAGWPAQQLSRGLAGLLPASSADEVLEESAQPSLPRIDGIAAARPQAATGSSTANPNP